jgi:uncharacterized protein (DUF2141 family)
LHFKIYLWLLLTGMIFDNLHALLFLFGGFFLQAKETVDFSVHITNIKSATAPIKIALYDKASSFPGEKGHYLAKNFVPGKTGEVIFTFAGVQEGQYAVALYQDSDNNNRLNTNFFGYPKEPFGFSNNIKPRFSSPSFRQCAVMVNKGQHDITIKLIN